MIRYGTDELISASDFAKRFGSHLERLKSKAIEKIGVLRNNKIEAVLISKEMYERMQEAYEKQEHLRLYKSPDFEKHKEMFQKIYSDISEGKEELIDFEKGMEEIDAIIDEIENAH